MSEPAMGTSDSASLERGYRRLLAWYPKWFRRENGEEILAVLMACAQDDQTRPSLEAAADLLRGALRMRLRPRPGQPRPVFAAIRLIWAAAVVELGAMITIIATAGTVRAAVRHADPAAVQAAVTHLTVNEIGGPLVIALWLWLAWTLNRARDAARFALASFFVLTTMSLLISLAQGGAAYAPADMVAGAVEWSAALAATVLIFLPASNRYYRREEPVLA